MPRRMARISALGYALGSGFAPLRKSLEFLGDYSQTVETRAEGRTRAQPYPKMTLYGGAQPPPHIGRRSRYETSRPLVLVAACAAQYNQWRNSSLKSSDCFH